MTWLYNGAEFTTIEQAPPKSLGFIYLITQHSTGKRYIGRKLLTAGKTKTVAGVKKKIRVESDWRTYWSSSPYLKELIKEVGEADFQREILQFCSGMGMMVYAEEFFLYVAGALENDNWFNANIRSKVYKNWVKVDEAAQMRIKVKQLGLI